MILIYTEQMQRIDERKSAMAVLSERLQELMKKRGINQKELAAKSGISQQSISNYLRGHAPRPETIAVMAKAFDTSTDYLLGLTDDERPLTDDERLLVDAYRRDDRETIDRLFADEFDNLFANDPTLNQSGQTSDS